MKKLFYTLISIASFATLNAQISLDTSFSISGSVDVYSRFNLNSTNNLSNGGTLAPGSSFANTPGFSLGMFNLKSSYSQPKYGFVADLVFGPRGKDAVFNGTGLNQAVNQLNGYYQLSDKVKATLGAFNTYLGYEVISPVANFNYSTSYLFSYGPFNHAGLKFDFDLGGGFSLATALMNPTDFLFENPTGQIFYGGQLGYTGDKGGIFLNYVGGDGTNQIDLTTSASLTDKFFVGFNASTLFDGFAGAAVYAQVAASDDLKFGLRAEHFKASDVSGGFGLVAPGESVTDLTFSLNYTVGNFRLIPEIRIDLHSDEAVTTDASLASPELSKSLASFVLAAVYSF